MVVDESTDVVLGGVPEGGTANEERCASASRFEQTDAMTTSDSADAHRGGRVAVAAPDAGRARWV
jgi:hypothetical protein